ncbi:lipid A-modifier LpxR family protein [Sulfurimonas sp.]|uniref:lipid A-modifier LpxR family protein n=1 Tax=Sulfurimonas sp. TaxID=2022749 RepID=UPI0025E1E458|nr:lipid A-modifier LpxR family protein [Sulfurimonas sp.]
MKNNKKLLALTSTLSADQFSFQLYNDFFAGTDQYFTNGLAISWLDDSFNHVPNSSVNAYSDFRLN